VSEGGGPYDKATVRSRSLAGPGPILFIVRLGVPLWDFRTKYSY
jgi:hypothetical protein